MQHPQRFYFPICSSIVCVMPGVQVTTDLIAFNSLVDEFEYL